MMVGTRRIALAIWLAAAGVNSAAARGAFHSQSRTGQLSVPRVGAATAQDPVPREQDPPPKEQEPPAKEPENKNMTVEGHVKLRDGGPAAGARIVAKGRAGTVANATADGAGKFRFTGSAGTYSLEIHAGDRSRTFKADIADGKLTPAEFTVE
jgi:hypothetical protein